jgi:CrcB protein
VTAIWFVAAAVVGALVRHGVNLLGRGWVGTLTLNVGGSFVLGWLVGAGASTDVVLVVGTAWCGSLTTFSTLALEVVEAHGPARITMVSTTAVGTVLAAGVGYAVG